MAILPVLSAVPQDVTLNQPYNTANELDDSNVPPECRLYRRSLDDKPAEFWDDERDHNEYEHLLHRLYVQGIRAIQLA